MLLCTENHRLYSHKQCNTAQCVAAAIQAPLNGPYGRAEPGQCHMSVIILLSARFPKHYTTLPSFSIPLNSRVYREIEDSAKYYIIKPSGSHWHVRRILSVISGLSWYCIIIDECERKRSKSKSRQFSGAENGCRQYSRRQWNSGPIFYGGGQIDIQSAGPLRHLEGTMTYKGVRWGILGLAQGEFGGAPGNPADISRAARGSAAGRH